ncbi:MAG: L,D-transpeptidase [Chloroflexia bacterium]|nr:L,D-transpeptidase [Chloroflexia bacterium]
MGEVTALAIRDGALLGFLGGAMGDGLPFRGAWRRVRSHGATAAISSFLALATLVVPHSVAAQSWTAPRTVYVSSTGHTADGLFLDLWRTDRALLGDPVTEEFRSRTGFTGAGEANVVQYFEHVALVYLPDEAPENQVQAIDLGRQALDEARAAGTSRALDRALDRAVCAPNSTGACVNVVTSGHTVRGPFLTFWQTGAAASWLGSPLTEAFAAPDRTRIQYFDNGILRLNANGNVTPLPLGRIAARRAHITTEPIPRPQDVPLYDETLFTPPPEATPVEEETGSSTDWSFGPGPQQGAWKEVVVSISAQSMWAYEEGELVMSSLVSTGTAEVPETTTPVGYHSVLAKFDAQTMEGTISGDYYRVEDVPFVMYFDDFGNAIHGTYWHSNFGAPMSHGCVNLPMDIAAWMYGWAPVGTAITVVG